MKLLVSVTNSREAEAALEGGADILDLKNPWESPLGASPPPLTREVCRRFGGRVPISAALGDFPHLPGTAGLACLGAAWCGVRYVKIGLYGPQTDREASELLQAVKDSAALAGEGVEIVAVGYADHADLATIDPILLPGIAAEVGIAGCMIDTFQKKGLTLFDWYQPSALRDFVANCHRQGLLAALAGSIGAAHLPLLAGIGPDIVGVRGAACRDANRLAGVSGEKVAELKEALVQLGKGQ